MSCLRMWTEARVEEALFKQRRGEKIAVQCQKIISRGENTAMHKNTRKHPLLPYISAQKHVKPYVMDRDVARYIDIL